MSMRNLSLFRKVWLHHVLKRALICGLSILALSLAITPVLAKKTGKDKTSNMVYVGPNQTINGNLFKAGNTVEIAGTVNGDLFVAGNMVNITGKIEGDVFAAGSMVKINADIGGSIRTLGSNIEISGQVGRSILAAGGNVIINQGTQVGWGSTLAGGNVEIRGRMNRNAEVGAGNLVIAGEIAGDLKAKIGDQKNQGQLTLFPTAIVRGNLDYTSAGKADIRSGAQITGQVTHHPYKAEAHSKFKFGKTLLFRLLGFSWLIANLIYLFGLLIIGLVLVGCAPKAAEKVNDLMLTKFWPNLGWGIVWFIITPIICFLLMLTLIGIPLALIGLALYLVSLCIVKVYAGITLGKSILKAFGSKNPNLFWSMILGVIVLVILISIPIIGWIIALILTWWGLGALVKFKKEELKKWR